MLKARNNYFYGYEVSDYAKQYKFVDYATLAKCFDAVLNNNIISELSNQGYFWDEENTEEYHDAAGNVYNAEEAKEKRDELEERRDELEVKLYTIDNDETPEAEEIREEIENIENDISSLYEPEYKEFFQYYIVSDEGARILREIGEALYYNNKLDIYVWGVDHWGTAWTHVLTNIPIEYTNE